MESNANIQKFYRQVLEQFKTRLFLVYRFKALSSEKLDTFTKKIDQKFLMKKDIFQTGIKMTLQKKSTKFEEKSVIKDTVKIQPQEQDYNTHPYGQKIISKQEIQKNEQSQQSQQIDDLNQFKKVPQIKQPIVKVQQLQQKVQQKLQNNSQQQYQQQDRKKEQILAKGQKKIYAHVIATYSTKTMKRIPKDQKTKIELENVFVRTADKEGFYAKITCDFSQAQYANIKL